MGLLDYLSFRVGKAVLDRLYNLLKPGGELVAGNFHVSNQSRYKMEYWGDWILIHRTEADFREMFENDGTSKVSIFFEDTGNQMFLHIQKP
jgi:extracellular factor (EF) 3-hydroxypalmitic acid methyl ester biosynthesis protein